VTSSFPKPLPRPFSAQQLIALVGQAVLGVSGDDRLVVRSVAALDEAEEGTLAFCKLTGEAGAAAIATSRASVIVGHPRLELALGRCLIAVDDPRAWFIAALRRLFPEPPPSGVHPSAVIGDGVALGPDVSIGPCAVIGDSVAIGAGSRIAAHVVIEPGCSLGRECRIGPNTTIGFQGLGVARDGDEALLAFPHLGTVRIGNRVETGGNCCFARGVLKDTVIADGVRFGNLVNVGHNCSIAEDAWISSGVVLGGSVSVGRRAQIGVSAIVRNQLSLGDDAQVGAGSVVMKNVPAGELVFGWPANRLPKAYRF
jgi:UDP-3-O-[3-hydroxymyristoyl] glucosamine N-acyltransferase